MIYNSPAIFWDNLLANRRGQSVFARKNALLTHILEDMRNYPSFNSLQEEALKRPIQELYGT